MIDGKVVGEAPLDVSRLYCGRRVRVSVVHPRVVSWERTIVPEEGKIELLSASLDRPTTALAVTSVPEGATVRVNGHDITSTPAAITLTAGTASDVEIVLPGYETYRRRVYARPGGTTPIDAVLTKR